MVPAARKAVKTRSFHNFGACIPRRCGWQDRVAKRCASAGRACNKIGRKLEEETTHAGAEQVGYVSEVADERLFVLAKRLTWVMSSEALTV
jgi:hypothetical protein